jgi:NAD(P)H-dependent FMN reductase
VFLVPEYNHSFPGALKNALDYVYREWNDKAAGIVSYGGWAAGVRAAEALRLVLAELQVATVRAQPAVPLIPAFTSGSFIPGEGLEASVNGMLDQLIAWSSALRSVRETKAAAVS